MIWHGMVWHGMIWHSLIWHGMIWHGMISQLWYDMDMVYYSRDDYCIKLYITLIMKYADIIKNCKTIICVRTPHKKETQDSSAKLNTEQSHSE